MEVKIKNQDKEEKKKPAQKKIAADGSELRQDLVTGDWVVIATGRAKRPEDYARSRKLPKDENLEECVFCDPEKSGQTPDVLIYRTKSGDWSLRVFPNLYPAFERRRTVKHREEGPYFAMDGVGYHEIVVTRDHFKQMALMDDIEVAEVLDAYQDRYISLMNRKSVNYIEIFHNHGKEAGASIAHPHSQLMAIPVVSPGVQLELDGAESYWRANKQCVYCTMAEFESESGKRVVYENNEFIAFCPFSSRAAFEVWVMPKKHKPYFERMNQEDKLAAGEVLKEALKRVYHALKDPAYNFYLHTSPADGKDYPHYHWHFEILPKTSTWAGFELSTGIEISTIEPEVAADYLRNIET